MTRKQYFAVVVFTLMGLLLFTISDASAQKKQKSVHIQAIAEGTSTQLGKIVSINIIINEYSTPDDQKALLEAFDDKGSEGLANALDKMNSKGRISITGTLGYDINYIREFKMPDGSVKIRFVTDRPITFGELWSAGRSIDYSLSLGEIIIAKDKNKSTGMLLPACRFKLDKDKELDIEALRNPWKLVSIKRSK